MDKIKSLLKEAKVELGREDYTETVSLCNQVLKIDKENYFALVFLGKAWSKLDQGAKNAFMNYSKAIDVDDNNILAWKGLFLLFKEATDTIFPDTVKYDEFFDLCGRYAKVLLRQELPQVDLIHDIRLLRKSKPECEESFLRHLVPGTQMAETLGRHFMQPHEVLTKLIQLVNKTEKEEISKVVTRERLRLSANDPEYQSKINSLAWEILKDSELEKLYTQLINITDDNEERRALETELLDHNIKVLNSMPAEQKANFFHKVKSMVEDMVLVNHDSVRAWKYYFEWQDYTSLDSFDLSLILKFYQKFPHEPVALILYAWACSNLSKYNVKELLTEQAKISQKHKEELEEETVNDNEADALKELMEEDEIEQVLLEDDVLNVLLANITKAQSSYLAQRIVSFYFIFAKEYEAALPYVKKGISLVAYTMRDMGATLVNSKRELCLDLATIYIYLDAPKNYKSALALFEKVLNDRPENTRAKLGKGIILIERENWNEAKNLLAEVLETAPRNLEAMSELAWSEANTGNFEVAINMFNDTIKSIEGTDLRTTELRAKNYWRKAKTYVMAEEKGVEVEENQVQTAYRTLVQSVKVLETFAPNYTLLGYIYSKFYKDTLRSFKCYTKAIELDAGDIEAAHYLINSYTSTRNWTAASAVAERLVAAENAKSKLKNISWPYRVIGVACLEKQQESDAIEWLQAAIRADSKDIESWVALGQAYKECGRIEASLKVFDKALELDSKHEYAQFFKATALASLGEFELCVELLNKIVQSYPRNTTFRSTLAMKLVDYAHDLYFQGFLTKSIHQAIAAIEIIGSLMSELKYFSQQLWTTLSEALRVFILVEAKAELLPVESLVSIFGIENNREFEDIDKIDGITIDTILSSPEENNISIASQFLVLSAKYALSTSHFPSLPATMRSSLYYNIGLSELTSYITVRNSKNRDAAIVAFKKSIQYQSNVVEAWLGLAITSMELNWRVSQHCFIKAIALSPRQNEAWFGLALLAIQNNDIDFANEILVRSQSMNPQESVSWLGLALVTEIQGKLADSSRLFAHAYVLSNGKSSVVEILYARSVLGNRVGKGNDERDVDATEDLTSTAYALENYFKKTPNDPFALQCALLTFERLHMYYKANEIAGKLSIILEKRFEKSQDEQELFNFAVIKAQFARIELGMGNYAEAMENAELSQGIVADIDKPMSLETQISNHISLGLANFFSDNFDETLEHFQELLRISKDSKHLIILISKVLYDVGSEETKKIAFEELTNYIIAQGKDLLTILLLASMSIIENSKEELQSSLSELLGLPLKLLISDRHRDVPFLIEVIRTKLQKPSSCNTWIRSAYYFPNSHVAWQRISERVSARITTGNQNKVTAQQQSNNYCLLKDLRSIQKSLYLCPWNVRALHALKECF